MGSGDICRFNFDKTKRHRASKLFLVLVLLVVLPLSFWVFFGGTPPDISPSDAAEETWPLPLYWYGSASFATSFAEENRPVYPYSVIPGGAHSKEELKKSLKNDPIVAAHYADFRTQSARLMRLNAARQVYVSYRLGDHVYWTSKKIALLPGEALLTDGTHLARARCGNRISETPAGPSSPGEPPLETLDLPMGPRRPEMVPGEAPVAPIFPFGGSPVLLALNSPGQSGSPGGTGAPFLPFFLCCGGGPGPAATPKSAPAPPGPAPSTSPPGFLPQPYPTPATPPVITPEPQTLALLLVGFAGLLCAWLLRRS